MSEQRKVDSKWLIEELWNKRNFDVIDEFYAPNFVLRRPPFPDYDFEGYKWATREGLKAFPDFQITIEEIIVEGDKDVIRYTWHGTNTGESSLVGPPTGKQVTVVGISIAHWEGGKRVDEWMYEDQLGFMRQLGFIP